MLGRPAVQPVEVDAVQDGDAVLHRPCNSATAARTSSSATGQPVRTSPGASTSTKPTRPPRRFLSRRVAAATSAGSMAGSSVVGRPAVGQQVGDLLAQPRLGGERERGQQAEADRLAVPVAAVARHRLDRVADRVAEVERLAAARVALVGGHDGELRARAGEHEVAVGAARRAPRMRFHSGSPAISAVLTTSAQPAASSSRGSVVSTVGSTITAAGWW